MEKDFCSQRNIYVNGLCYKCNISRTDNIEYWTAANATAVAEVLKKNGAEVLSIDCSDVPERIEVDRSIYHFLGETFMLSQCDDIFEWFKFSSAGDFTYYKDRVVFHCSDDHYYAAYRDDIEDYFQI